MTSEQILDGMKPGTFMVRRNRHVLSYWQRTQSGILERDSGFRLCRVDQENVNIRIIQNSIYHSEIYSLSK